MRVLIVDDNPTNLRVSAAIVSQIAGAVALTFDSSADALAWCANTEPDLLVVDYRMPSPDGLAFMAEYRVLWPDAETPIVMMTAETDRDVRHRALELGASDFLTKPADPIEFQARVRNLLALRQSRVALRARAASLAEEVERATREVVEREEETIQRLMRAAEFRDNETGNHIVRMGRYAEVVGADLGMDPAQQRLLLLATPMHDIGKVSTPDRILLKPGPLTPDEWVIMRQHTTAGFAMLEGSSSRILQVAAEIALRHHERWDGSGYPGGLGGEAIPIFARIAAVCDVFDALISVRPYKRAWTADDAFAEIERCAGTHFDPAIARAFLEASADVRRIERTFSDAVPA
jgi:response regulator RpfG family c-di-GMP phosphodiesterase